jgi:hypothetical protein
VAALYRRCSVEHPRKGFELLLSALHRLPESLRKRSLMLVLDHTDAALLRQVNLETVSLGFVTETEKKVLADGAADVFTFRRARTICRWFCRKAWHAACRSLPSPSAGVPDQVRDDETGFATWER